MQEERVKWVWFCGCGSHYRFMCCYSNMQQLVSLVLVNVWLSATQAVTGSLAISELLLKNSIHYNYYMLLIQKTYVN